MANFGLTDQGLSIMAFADVVTTLENGFRSAISASIPLGDRTLFGVVIRIFAEQIAALWDLFQVLYAATDADAATGTMLEAVSAYTGTFRPDASRSTVTLTCGGVDGTVIPAASIARTLSNSIPFQTTIDTTLDLIPVLAAGPYVIGDRVFYNGYGWQCTQAGTATSSISISFSHIFSIGTSGTCVFLRLGLGEAWADIEAVSTDYGPWPGAAHDITVMGTAVVGWQAVINVVDAIEGTDVGTDQDLRVLREAEITRVGSGTTDALRADILAIDTANILSCTVFDNKTDVTDTNGLPPHTVEALVRTSWVANATKDQVIVDALGDNVTGGIGTYGSSSGTYVDTLGNSQTIYFSRPAEVPVYVTVTVKYIAKYYPADGDAQIKQAIVDYGNGLDVGTDAVAAALGAQAFKVAGVFDVPRSGSLGGCLISTAASPTADTTIVMAARQLGTYSTLNVVVNSAAVSP